MKTKLVNLLIILLIFATTLVAILYLPDEVPVHFGVDGEPDRFGSKYELFILPASALLIWILADRGINVFTKKSGLGDEEKAKSDIEANEKATNTTLTATSAVLFFLNFGVLYMTFSNIPSYSLPEIDIIKILVMLLGLMMIFMGNVMPKTRTNSLIGFRCRWTMYNDITWRKSNLFAGFVCMISGVLSIITGLIFKGIVAAMIMLGVMICASTVMMIYAYNVYKKERNNGKFFEK